MKTYIIIFASLYLFVCGCAHAQPQNGIPDWQFERGVIQHPTKPKVRYYCAGRSQLAGVPSEPKKYVGFWVWSDDDQRWWKTSDITSFEEVFIHPNTDTLYAILGDEYLHTDTNGIISTVGGNKLTTSKDGRDWFDITPAGGHIPDAFCIFPDPYNPNRVCVLDHNPNLGVYQSLTDDYSKWKRYSAGEWEDTHNGWDWDAFDAVLSTGSVVQAAQHITAGDSWKDDLRRKCHVAISKQGSYPHDAFLELAKIGNKASVPLLIAALRWQEQPQEHEGQMLTVCTTGHCIEALSALTGVNFGFDPDRWEQWWKEKGQNLPVEHFKARTANKTNGH